MKKTALAATGLTALALLAPKVWADNTGSSNVTVAGTIVQSLELTSTNLVMPHITRPRTGEPVASVSLTCGATSDTANVVQYVPNSNPFADGVAAAISPASGSANKLAFPTAATGSCAEFAISGQTNYSFKISINTLVQPTTPASGVTIGGVQCKDANSITRSNGDTVNIGPTGTRILRCGATVDVDPETPAGIYSGGSFAFTVTYD